MGAHNLIPKAILAAVFTATVGLCLFIFGLFGQGQPGTGAGSGCPAGCTCVGSNVACPNGFNSTGAGPGTWTFLDSGGINGVTFTVPGSITTPYSLVYPASGPNGQVITWTCSGSPVVCTGAGLTPAAFTGSLTGNGAVVVDPVSGTLLKSQTSPPQLGSVFISGTTGATDTANRLSSNGDTNTTQATAANTAFGLADNNTAANLFVGGSWYDVNFSFDVSTFSTSATLTIVLQINGVTSYVSNAVAPTNSTSHAGLLMHCVIWSGAGVGTVSSSDPIYTQCGYTGPSAAWNFSSVQNVTTQPVTAINPTTHFFINAAARWTNTIANNGNIIWGQVLKTVRSF